MAPIIPPLRLPTTQTQLPALPESPPPEMDEDSLYFPHSPRSPATVGPYVGSLPRARSCLLPQDPRFASLDSFAGETPDTPRRLTNVSQLDPVPAGAPAWSGVDRFPSDLPPELGDQEDGTYTPIDPATIQVIAARVESGARSALRRSAVESEGSSGAAAAAAAATAGAARTISYARSREISIPHRGQLQTLEALPDSVWETPLDPAVAVSPEMEGFLPGEKIGILHLEQQL